jgi:hypothetical protein
MSFVCICDNFPTSLLADFSIFLDVSSLFILFYFIFSRATPATSMRNLLCAEKQITIEILVLQLLFIIFLFFYLYNHFFRYSFWECERTGERAFRVKIDARVKIDIDGLKPSNRRKHQIEIIWEIQIESRKCQGKGIFSEGSNGFQWQIIKVGCYRVKLFGFYRIEFEINYSK